MPAAATSNTDVLVTVQVTLGDIDRLVEGLDVQAEVRSKTEGSDSVSNCPVSPRRLKVKINRR